MVKLYRGSLPVFLPLFLTILSGCAPLKQWWGEAPEKPAVIQLPASRTKCAEAITILNGGEDESEKTFECLAAQVTPLWTDVNGREKSTLTDQEIAILVRKGGIDAGDDPEALLRKIYSAKKLLGLGPTLTREAVERWIGIFRTHRARLRLLYRSFKGDAAPPSFADIRGGVRFADDALKTMNWSMDSEQLVRLIRDLVDISNSDVRNALIPAARAGINLLNAVCPTFTSKDLWATSELGSCLVRAVDHFEMGAAWFDFAVHSERRYSAEQIRSIRIALELLNEQFDSWFHQKELSPILTSRWIDLSRSLGVDPPADILAALELVHRFHPGSSGSEIHPTAFSGAFGLIRRFETNILEGLPYFVQALDNKACVDPETTHWTKCVPTDLAGIRKRSKVIDLASRVSHPRFGNSAAPFDGGRFSRVMIFHVLSGQIVGAFDEDRDGRKDGLISAGNGRGENEVARLITVGLTGYETVRGFVDNILRRWKSEPVIPVSSERVVDLAGLARLITMAHDVLVQRPPEDRNAFEEVVANLLNSFPGSAMYLDQLSVTSVIVLADELSGFRAQYLDILPQEKVVTDGEERGTVLRTQVAAALPEILKRNFPRTYESCTGFGFEASCGIALVGLLPGTADNDDRAIYVNDLDLLTIALASVEGLLDTCDANENGKLSWDTLDGEDELDCGFIRIKDILKRLIEADVIHASSRDRVLANLALETINSTFVTRIIGKTALVRGTKKNILLYWPLFWNYKSAKIGSMLGLVADIMEPDRAEKARKAAKRERKEREKKPPTG